MSRSASTRWYGALAALIVFLLLAWLLGEVLTLSDGERTVVRVAFVALGLVAAAAVLWFLRVREAPVAEPTSGNTPDVLATVAAARARLPRGKFEGAPVVLVVGSEGSCKTTVVLRSGANPELLAGDALASGGELPLPTATANFWVVGGTVIAEAGGKVFSDDAGWTRFVRALRAPRMAAALGRAAAAPRSAVVCVSCEVLVAPDARAQLEALGKVTRQRLATAARELGVALPVYVLFTRADRIPHFETWVAPLTRDEVRAPLGHALPFDAAAVATAGGAGARAAGTYAERIVPRLESAFARVVAALATRRPDFLGRESQSERRLAAYELPREVGKLAPEASRFLEEICRPAQIGVSPQLRGFYFVGARPVVVTDAGPAQAAAPAPASPPSASDATGVFAQPAQARAAAPIPQAKGGSRRVPQWVFIERLFPDVVLADGSATRLAGGGTRVAGLRRALLGLGVAAALLLVFGVTRAWMGNRSLAARTADAARDVAALPVVTAPAGTVVFPSADALRRLEALRGVLDTLHTYRTEGVPGRLRWGLWRGEPLFAAGSRVWLEGYRRHLHASAYGALLDSLRLLPVEPRPSDDYGTDYALLKAYLVMTAESPRSTPDILAPVLFQSWARGATVDADIAALARRQFEFYSVLLASENPWPEAADARIVERTRTFLGKFSGSEQIYQFMLAQANKAAPTVKLVDVAVLAPGVVNAPAEVPGAFTAEGWTFMEGAFTDSDRFFEGEPWVVGDAGAARGEERERIIAELRERYRTQYVQRWRDFVRAVSVARLAGGREAVGSAAKQLGVLGGAQSPLLATLALVARNTAVDSAMSAAFQPVHAVTPPDVADKFVNDGNQGYVNGLVALQGALEQVSYMPPIVDTASAEAVAQAGQQALAQVTQAKIAARQLAQKFAVDTAAVRVGPPLAALLESPINGAEGVLRQVAATRPPAARREAPVVAAGGGGPPPPPAAGGGGGGGGEKAAELAAILNERGRAICAAATPMLSKFPFNPDATAEATVAEVAGVLAPGTGALFAFQQERLGDLLEKQGAQWVAKGGGVVTLSAPFVTFFNRAAQVSAALFSGGSAPRVVFLARGMASETTPQVIITHGTQLARFRTNTPLAQFVWPAPSGRDAKLFAQFGRGREQVIAQATGEWAIFRLVAQAARAEGGGGALRAEWNATGRDASPVAVEFTFESGAPVLQRAWLGGMSCAPQVTR